MSNIDTNLRDKYFSNEIFRIGDLVEDVKTSEKVKILDRGSNYVTVATASGIVKKWLYEVNETTQEEVSLESLKKQNDFEILESGQIRLFGYDTRNFEISISEFLLEQFREFEDLYSKHQIIKCLDLALEDCSHDRRYELLERIEKFYTTQNIEAPSLIESMKSDTERTRIAEILATIAEVKPSKINSKTVTDSITALRKKLKTRKEWEVLFPFLKLAQSSGLPGAVQNLPYGISPSSMTHEDFNDELIIELMIENIEMVVDDLEYEDIIEAFPEMESSVNEILTDDNWDKVIVKSKRNERLGKPHTLDPAASSVTLMQRARRLAEIMAKRRIFNKSTVNMSNADKERYEASAFKRSALVAKLSSKMIEKVRGLQSSSVHHTKTPASETKDHSPVATIGAS